MSNIDFRFKEHAPNFEAHIGGSIPGLADLREQVASIAPRFVQPHTTVVDIGTSSGVLLRRVRDELVDRRPGVEFVGIDIESTFEHQWERLRAPDLTYKVADVRNHHFRNVSLAISIFTLQFLPQMDKPRLLRSIHDGLVDGGCLIIAEKLLANTPRMQDALTFPFYDRKIANGFTPEEILAKERRLRGYMTSVTESELHDLLRQAGFRHSECIWKHFPFAAMIVEK